MGTSVLPSLAGKPRNFELCDKPYTATSADLKNFKRRIRRIALETLLNDETQKQRQQMMTLDFNERLKHLNYSKESDLTVNDKTQQIIHNIEEDGEEDLEAQHTDPNASIEIRRELDENDGNGDVNVDIEITYETAVRAFMQAMMENSLSQHKDMKNNPANCPLCQEDDTITNPR
ncbi:unnamed protein product [Fusarium langsethiae]|nr:unnamed protein product [Fusarium langsethiae]